MTDDVPSLRLALQAAASDETLPRTFAQLLEEADQALALGERIPALRQALLSASHVEALPMTVRLLLVAAEKAVREQRP